VNIKEVIIKYLLLILIGGLVVVGMRIAEWIIPQPEMRVIICTANDTMKIDTCKSAADLLKKAE
jgi:hypothetical protein